MYGGVAHAGYVCSLASLFAMCAQNGIQVALECLTHESLIPRARNMLVKKFLENPSFTHLFFWDADIMCDPNDILKIVSMDKDIIGMPYAKKALDWNVIAGKAKEAGERATGDILSKCSLSYILRTCPQQDPAETVYEAEEIGTGLMLIKREVLLKMIAAFPDLYAISDDPHVPADSRKYAMLFDTMVDETKRFLSEDYAFCRRWRRMRGSIHVYLPVKTTHYGQYAYEYNSSTIKLVT
jgi:hypothetical protein